MKDSQVKQKSFAIWTQDAILIGGVKQNQHEHDPFLAERSTCFETTT